jgi:ribosomal protein S18 acetylase RimI-like enzyme
MDAGADIRIRPLAASDAPDLLSMMRELARFENQEHLIAATEESIRRDAFGATPLFSGYIALADAKSAGFVTYAMPYNIWGARRVLLVDDLFVREAFRRRGIARRLMAAIETLVLERGTYARWTVSPSNERAIAFYKSLGARYILKGMCYWHLEGLGAVPEAETTANRGHS